MLAEGERVAAIERAKKVEKEKDGPDADINQHLIDMSIVGEDSETDEMELVKGGDSTVASPPAKKQKGKATELPTAGNKRSNTNSILRWPARSELT